MASYGQCFRAHEAIALQLLRRGLVQGKLADATGHHVKGEQRMGGGVPWVQKHSRDHLASHSFDARLNIIDNFRCVNSFFSALRRLTTQHFNQLTRLAQHQLLLVQHVFLRRQPLLNLSELQSKLVFVQVAACKQAPSAGIARVLQVEGQLGVAPPLDSNIPVGGGGLL